MASYQARRREPLLDQTTQMMLERRGRELLGVVLVALALAVAALLGSYSPQDPGWMVATDAPVQNLLGRAGAAMASTLMIIAGLGAWGIAVVLVAWGLRYVLHRGEDRALGRAVFAVIAVALASVFAATHVPGAGWPHPFGLGGLFGDTMLGAALGVAPMQAGFGLKLASLVSGLALLGLGLFVTGFDRRELRAIGRFLLVGLVVSYSAAMWLVGRGTLGTARAVLALQQRQHQRRAVALAARAAVAGHAADEPAGAGREPVLQRAALRAEPMVEAAGRTDGRGGTHLGPTGQSAWRSTPGRSAAACAARKAGLAGPGAPAHAPGDGAITCAVREAPDGGCGSCRFQQ